MYGLMPTLKNEIVSIAPQGRVNSVNPGWVATPLAEKTLEDKKFVERALATTPLQKVGRPADVARQVAVLASPVLSGHVNGVNLQVGRSSCGGDDCECVDSNSMLQTAEWKEGFCFLQRCSSAGILSIHSTSAFSVVHPWLIALPAWSAALCGSFLETATLTIAYAREVLIALYNQRYYSSGNHHDSCCFTVTLYRVKAVLRSRQEARCHDPKRCR